MKRMANHKSDALWTRRLIIVMAMGAISFVFLLSPLYFRRRLLTNNNEDPLIMSVGSEHFTANVNAPYKRFLVDQAQSLEALQSYQTSKELVYTQNRERMVPTYKGTFNHLFQIVEKFSDKVCKGKRAPRSGAIPTGPILPRCPTAADSNSASDKDDGASCALRDNSTWASLHPSLLDKISIKVLRLLISNHGCDDLLDPKSGNVQHQFFRPLRVEYREEMTFLDYGAGCGNGADFFTDYLAGAARINYLGIDDRSPMVRYSKTHAQVEATSRLSRSLYQPSVAEFCLSAANDISWIGSETFNAVLAADRLRAVPAADVCRVVNELLRVTKTGGSVWVGHIEDPEQVNALRECKLDSCDGYNVEMSQIKERLFLSRVGLPPALLAPNPYSFLWRKESTSFMEDVNELKDKPPARQVKVDLMGGM